MKQAIFPQKIKVCSAYVSLKKAIRTENSSLTKEVQDLKAKQNDQVRNLIDYATIFFKTMDRPDTFKHSHSVVCLFLPSPKWNLSIVVFCDLIISNRVSSFIGC